MYKVLIVDDDKIIRIGLKTIIEENSSSFEIVAQASNGKRAIEVLQNTSIDIMITDYKMPVMDGIELLKSIKELGINVKIIVLSGFDEYRYVRDTMKNGAIDYLLKPIQNEEIMSTLEGVKNKIDSERLLKEQIQEYSGQMSQNISLMKESFLLSLIKGDFSEDEYLKRKQVEMGITNISCYYLIIVSIDDIYTTAKSSFENINVSALNMLKYLISRVLTEAGQDEFLITVYDSEIVLLLLINENINYEFKENGIGILKLNSEKETNFTLTFGVSKAGQQLSKVHIAYHQAKFAVNRKFYEGKNRIIDYNPEKCCYYFANPNQFKVKTEELLNYIQLGESIKVKKCIEGVFDSLLKMNVEPIQFREIISKVVDAVDSHTREFSCGDSPYLSDEADFGCFIEYLDTAEELRSYLSETFFTRTERLNYERAEKSKKVIEIAKEYIKKHYKENISLKVIADHVYLNPNYFSELFKNEVGTNFVNYLIEVRINQAKKLLSDPRIKVYEVGQLVGYEEAVSFNRSFKKIVGVSPSQYRNIIK